jgi:hypothetical protein
MEFSMGKRGVIEESILASCLAEQYLVSDGPDGLGEPNLKVWLEKSSRALAVMDSISQPDTTSTPRISSR